MLRVLMFVLVLLSPTAALASTQPIQLPTLTFEPGVGHTAYSGLVYYEEPTFTTEFGNIALGVTNCPDSGNLFTFGCSVVNPVDGSITINPPNYLALVVLSLDTGQILNWGYATAWQVDSDSQIILNTPHGIVGVSDTLTHPPFPFDIYAGFSPVTVYSLTGVFNLPIPEPSIWSMMLLGFAAIGQTLRRRNRFRVPQPV